MKRSPSDCHTCLRLFLNLTIGKQLEYLGHVIDNISRKNECEPGILAYAIFTLEDHRKGHTINWFAGMSAAKKQLSEDLARQN